MATPDQVWKAPVGETEEFDRIMASRMAAAAVREIPAESVEAYWRQWNDPAIAEDIANAPDALVEASSWLYGGEGHLLLPDGARWVLVHALLNTDLHEGDPGDNAFLRRLHALLVEHKALRADEAHMGPRLPAVMLKADTLDVRRVFCANCQQWVDLVADAEEADQTLAPWED